MVTAKQDDLLSGRVIGHPMQESRRRLVRYESFGPVIAVPNPRIVQPAGCVLRAAKQHNLLADFVVGHAGISAGGRSVDWILERPTSVPDPGCVVGRNSIRTSE